MKVTYFYISYCPYLQPWNAWNGTGIQSQEYRYPEGYHVATNIIKKEIVDNCTWYGLMIRADDIEEAKAKFFELYEKYIEKENKMCNEDCKKEDQCCCRDSTKAEEVVSESRVRNDQPVDKDAYNAKDRVAPLMNVLEEAYDRGFQDGIHSRDLSMTHEKAVNFITTNGWLEEHDRIISETEYKRGYMKGKKETAVDLDQLIDQITNTIMKRIKGQVFTAQMNAAQEGTDSVRRVINHILTMSCEDRESLFGSCDMEFILSNNGLEKLMYMVEHGHE